MKLKYFLFFILIQKLLLYTSFYFFRIFHGRVKQDQWVIGVDEMASMIYLLGKTVTPSKTISLSNNPFYKLPYDYHIPISSKIISYLVRGIYGPILLGYLANRSNLFWYIWSTGFLLDRDFEFKFLKSKNKKIVCMFVGDDIRVPRLMTSFCKENDLDTFIDYVGEKNPYYLSDTYHNEKKKTARSADKYADVIFSASICQKSFIQKKQYFIPYMYDKKSFNFNPRKFKNIERLKILHAPSNPFVKGTALVRAAVKKLRMEGYDFEYVELRNVTNVEVLEHLKSTHIVLNQFYAFLPGLFGIEGMANHCAVLQSANPDIETGLPQDDHGAWLVTGYWEIFDNIKYLMDNPDKIEFYANRGYQYVCKHHTFEASSVYIRSVLNENGITY